MTREPPSLYLMLLRVWIWLCYCNNNTQADPAQPSPIRVQRCVSAKRCITICHKSLSGWNTNAFPSLFICMKRSAKANLVYHPKTEDSSKLPLTCSACRHLAKKGRDSEVPVPVGQKLKLFSHETKQRHEKTGSNKGMGKCKMRNADCPNHLNEIIFAVYPIESSGLVYK